MCIFNVILCIPEEALASSIFYSKFNSENFSIPSWRDYWTGQGPMLSGAQYARPSACEDFSLQTERVTYLSDKLNEWQDQLILRARKKLLWQIQKQCLSPWVLCGKLCNEVRVMTLCKGICIVRHLIGRCCLDMVLLKTRIKCQFTDNLGLFFFVWYSREKENPNRIAITEACHKPLGRKVCN